MSTELPDWSALHERTAELVRLAKAEDLGPQDATGELLTGEIIAQYQLVGREHGVLCGCPLVPTVLAAYDDRLAVEWSEAVVDGYRIESRAKPLAVIRGPLRSVLAVERTLLNFLQHLSGVASLTRRFVDAIEGTNARVYDTRKTIPGFRALDKYAVRCGGACNHRMGLFDAILIKENHLAGVEPGRLAGVVFEMLNRASALDPAPLFVEVEAHGYDQFEALLTVVGIDVIMLDNFSLTDIERAVRRRDELGLRGKIALEASGGVTLEQVRALADTGVERIAVGALTHSAPALDLALEPL